MKNLYTSLAVLLLFIAYGIRPTAALAQPNEKVGIGVRLLIDSASGYKTTLIIGIVPGGAAEGAGLQTGDYIVKVNGQSTRGLELEEVVSRIVGSEGTEVTLAIDRKGSTRNYTIRRGKYKFANSFYVSAVTDNEFCNALSRLMNDAPYDFKATCDTIHYTDEKGMFGRRNYECKVKVPGAQKVIIESSFGRSGIISFGPYANEDDVNTAAEDIIGKIKTCFPDYYYKTVISDKGSHIIEIGRSGKDNYESAILEMFSAYSETAHNFILTLRVNGGKATIYNPITSAVQNTPFANALRTIYNDIPKKYANVKGTRHDVKGTGLFSMGSTWYEINPVPDGAHDCSLSEGGLDLSNGCNCRYYSGTDRAQAVESFKKIYNDMYYALGSEFVYSLEAPEMDMTIPDKTESTVVFGIKKRRTFESIPLIALVLVNDSEGHYVVNMLFHDFGF